MNHRTLPAVRERSSVSLLWSTGNWLKSHHVELRSLVQGVVAEVDGFRVRFGSIRAPALTPEPILQMQMQTNHKKKHKDRTQAKKEHNTSNQAAHSNSKRTDEMDGWMDGLKEQTQAIRARHSNFKPLCDTLPVYCDLVHATK